MSAIELWQNATAIGAPVPPSLYPLLAYVSLSGGLLAAGVFVVQGKNTSVFQQFQTSILASLFLGFGAIFTTNAVGVYV
ncbi:hypothetical protein BCR43DRAFT_511053 [Syncephalastrum racemosum]|uniref:Dolichyl-diphosphooligosaccharide-protein glycosyltransferase subunit OST5 n=1 Tax=Syncephalastrum racemosum TaxID=13706 RepID=A0A1X2HKZ5_SYNRA|nr:hypothetical protein BCR43DRAFT_511053 [Syncephalastrum racemosum]